MGNESKGAKAEARAIATTFSKQGRVGDYESCRIPIENMTLGMALKLCDALKVSNPRKLLEAEKPKENTSES